MAADSLRGFVCVSLAPEVRVFLRDFMAEARKSFPAFRFVPSDNLHITLEFLGNDVPRATVPRLLEAIGGSAEDIDPFDLCLGYASAFPPKGLPRVLYVGTGKGTDRLVQLAHSVRSALRPLGFEADKPFQSHITLARRKRGVHPAGAPNERALWKKAFSRWCDASLCWHVSEVLLMESTLAPTGAVYSELGRVALPGRR